MVNDRESEWLQHESKRWLNIPRDSEAPYHCAPGSTPEQTYANIAEHVAELIESITTKLRPQETTPQVDRIRRWHRFIFLDTFPGTAGRFRSEPCLFGVPLPDEPDPASWKFKPLPGAEPQEIRPQLEQVVEAFQELTPPRQGEASPDEAGQACAEFFTALLRIHPFVDGNMRLSNTILLGTIRQFGYKPTSFLRPHDVEFAATYSTALRPDDKQSLEPLAELIAERIRKL